MKKLFLILTLSALIFQSCKKEECPECFSPPAPFVLELVDKTTGENLFTNGTYEESQIEVINTDDGSQVAFDFLSEDGSNLIHINTIGWGTQMADYEVKIASETLFNLKVDAEVVTENCCTFTRYNEVQIEGAQYEMDAQSGVYKIMIE